MITNYCVDIDISTVKIKDLHIGDKKIIPGDYYRLDNGTIVTFIQTGSRIFTIPVNVMFYDVLGVEYIIKNKFVFWVSALAFMGDNLCASSEFMKPDDIVILQKEYGGNFPINLHPFGVYPGGASDPSKGTDDTTQAYLFLKALKSSDNPETVAINFINEMLVWYREKHTHELENITVDVGNNTQKILNSYNSSKITYTEIIQNSYAVWRDFISARKSSNIANGSAMRVFTAAFNNSPNTPHSIILCSLATHLDKNTVVVSLFIYYVIIHFKKEIRLSFDDLMIETINNVKTHESYINDIFSKYKIDDVFQGVRNDINWDELTKCTKGGKPDSWTNYGTIYVTLRCALYVFKQFYEKHINVEKAIEMYYYQGGDSDTVATIGCAMIGAVIAREPIRVDMEISHGGLIYVRAISDLIV